MTIETSSRRRYGDACGTAHALELIGERWALLVVRELMLGPKRFSDLRADLPGLSANVLTQRLEGLEASGLVVRRRLPPPASVQVYELTPWGLEAETFIKSMGKWAARSPLHDPTAPISASSIVLSFRTMFDAGRAGDFTARVAFVMDQQTFVADIAKSNLQIDRGDPAGADAVLTGAPGAIAGVVYGGQPLDAMIAAGAVSVSGDRSALDRYVTLFPLPAKVGAEA